MGVWGKEDKRSILSDAGCLKIDVNWSLESMNTTDYFKRGNFAINSFILGSSTIWKHKFIGIGETPHISIKDKTIYSPPFGQLTETENKLVYSASIHENAHALLTPQDPDPNFTPLVQILVNAMEDLRIESVISNKYPVASHILKEGNQIVLDKAMQKKDDSKKMNPIMEAIFGMMSSEMNMDMPISKEAKVYYDKAYPEFSKWKEVKDFDNKNGYYGIVKLAKKIESIINELKEQQKQDQNNSSNQGKNNGSDGNNNNSSDKSDNQKNQNVSGESDSSALPDLDENNRSKGCDQNKNNDSNDDQSNSEENANNNKSDKTDADENESDNCEQSNSGRESVDNNGFDEGQNDLSSNVDVDKDLESLENSSSLDDIKGEMISKISKQSLENSFCYTCDTSHDKFNVPDYNPEDFYKAYGSIKNSISSLYRYLEQSMIAYTRCHKLSGLDNGKIDFGKIHLLSKSLTKNVFYKTVQGKQVDTCISICIDESGSMHSSYRKVRSLVIAFCECLNKLGIPFQVIGSTTSGDYSYRNKYESSSVITRYNPIVYDFFKKFDEQYDFVKYRLGNIRAYNNYIDGEMVEGCCLSMAQRREKRKIVLSFSDGEPCAGQGNDYEMGKNLIDVLDKYRKKGFQIYGFGIGTSEPKRYYGDKHFIYLSDINNMDYPFFKSIVDIIGIK